MKQKIILIVIILICLGLIYFAYTVISNQKKEINRLSVNQRSLATGSGHIEKKYTKKEFQAYQKYADSSAASKGIKTKYITRYTKIKETITDTVFLPLERPSTESDVQVFHYNSTCLNAFGIVQNDSVELSYSYNNELHLFNYWRHSTTPFIKRLFTWEFSKTYSAICVSACSGDTLQILENIELIKK